jgi:peptidoglycan biosynthesis protein MviN/MurJ (putative lipid II flippase)
VALNLILNWLFTLQLGWGHRGLAFATACIATTNFLILYLLMRRHLGMLESRALLSMFTKVLLASAALAAICWLGSHFLLSNWATQPFWPKLGALFLVIAVAGGAFFGCALALQIGELHDITQAVRRRFRRAR